jgi:beta-lactamase class A
MKQLAHALRFVLASLSLLASLFAAATAPQRCDAVDPATLHAPYAFSYGLSTSQLQSTFYGKSNVANDGSHNDAGYRPLRLTGYVDGGEVRYATRWIKDGNTGWSSQFGLTGAQFHARFVDLKAQGYRLIDASGYTTAGGVRYADVWVKNTAGIGWAVSRDVLPAQMNALEAHMRGQGFAPTRIEGYTLGGGTRYIVTWVTSGCDWLLEEALSSAQYQAFFDAHVATMRPLHVDAYTVGSKVQFASIFWRQAGPPVRASHGQHWYMFQASLNDGSCDGYVPETFYGLELGGGWETFGGIWSYRGVPSVDANSSAGTRIAYQVNCAQGRAGAAFINASTGESVLVNADQTFGSASAIKSTVLYALLRKADAEDIDLDATEVDGVSLAELATTMIEDSSNSATNTLIDYVGRAQVNAELAALGLQVIRVNRYLTGGPSAHGLGSWFDDFKAGHDNLVTPRELATFWRRVYENTGLLSTKSHDFFLTVTDRAATLMNDALPGGYDPAFVRIHDKPGGKTYGGVVGDFAHRPQLGAHKVAAEGGVMLFANGQRVFYAAMVDQAAPAASLAAIACTGWEAAKTWAGVGSDEGDGAGFCDYP